MHKLILFIRLLLLLCLWNPAVSLDVDLMDIINSVHQSPAGNVNQEPLKRNDVNSSEDKMLPKLLTQINSIRNSVEELQQMHKATFAELMHVIQHSCKSNSDSVVPLSNSKPIIDSQANALQAEAPHAMRCSSYRALDEFMPVDQVKSNEMLIEAGWDAIYGPMYFCHALVDVNGIKCRLYGKGNRRSCWVTLPTGREHKVDKKFHLLKKPHGVNIEWRTDWPVDVANVPIPVLRNKAGVPHGWAIWDVYTCGLAPKFYFGRCIINGRKIPGLIHSNQVQGLTYTHGGKEATCASYDVLVCTNK